MVGKYTLDDQGGWVQDKWVWHKFCVTEIVHERVWHCTFVLSWWAVYDCSETCPCDHSLGHVS